MSSICGRNGYSAANEICVFCWLPSRSRSGCLSAEPDPLEPFNRATFAFNDVVDRVALRPVAVAYHNLVPSIAQQGIYNFFDNLGELSTVVNAALQGKPDESVQAVGRFVFNSTLGLGGLVDFTGAFGEERTSEDFGQRSGSGVCPRGPTWCYHFLGRQRCETPVRVSHWTR